MNVGIMLMSDEGPDGKPTDWREHLEKCKRHGLEAVDVFERMVEAAGETVAGMKQSLDDLGLKPSIFCERTDLVSPDPAVRGESLDAIRRGVDGCAELGVDQLFSYGGQHDNEGEDAFARYVDGLQQAADLCAEAGVTLSIENAGKMCHTDADLRRCIESVGRENMKVTLDGGNFVLAGCDPLAATDVLAADVVHVHVKSLVPDPGDSSSPFRYCPTDQGSPDYRRVRDALVAAEFDGCMSFEPSGGLDSDWYHSLDVLTAIVREAR